MNPAMGERKGESVKYRILDLDNCLADDRWRIAEIDWTDSDLFRRYIRYHQLSAFDELGNAVLAHCAYRNIIITGRPEFFRSVTTEWLKRKRIPHEFLLMRANDDTRSSATMKRGAVIRLNLDHGINFENVECAFDDNEQVVEMYRALGLTAQVSAIHDVSVYRMGAL